MGRDIRCERPDQISRLAYLFSAARLLCQQSDIRRDEEVYTDEMIVFLL